MYLLASASALNFPVLFHAGPLAVHAHFVFESLAYTLGFAGYRRLRRRRGDFLGSPDRISVIVAAILGAALGSKVLYWCEDPVLTRAHWLDPQYLLEGKTIVGGLLGGTMAVEWIKSRSGITRRTGDLFALPMTAAIALGRIGCFLEGLPDHTYGVTTALPWGVDFGDGIRRHPTQLYETLFMTTLAVFLARRKPSREGDSWRIFLIVYLAFRLCVDFLKPGAPLAGLTAIQWACLAAIIAYWRDVVFFLSPGSAQRWEIESGPTSFTTPLSRSARNATGGATPK